MGNDLSSVFNSGRFSEIKMIRDLKQMSSDKRLKEFGLFSLEEGS